MEALGIVYEDENEIEEIEEKVEETVNEISSIVLPEIPQDNEVIETLDDTTVLPPPPSSPVASPIASSNTIIHKECKLFLGGIPWEMTTDILTEHFKVYGTVQELSLMTDKLNGNPRGFGFVTFSSTDRMYFSYMMYILILILI